MSLYQWLSDVFQLHNSFTNLYFYQYGSVTAFSMLLGRKHIWKSENQDFLIERYICDVRLEKKRLIDQIEIIAVNLCLYSVTIDYQRKWKDRYNKVTFEDRLNALLCAHFSKVHRRLY